MEEELLKEELKKTEELRYSTEYLQKYGRQENLMTYFFNYATLRISKTQ